MPQALDDAEREIGAALETISNMTRAPRPSEQVVMNKVLGGTGFTTPKMSLGYLSGMGDIGAYDPKRDTIQGGQLDQPWVLGHETTHALQRRGSIPSSWVYQGAGYDYGGPASLEYLYKKGITEPDVFNKEQQGDIVGDWVDRSYSPWIKDDEGYRRDKRRPLTPRELAVYAIYVQKMKQKAIENTTPEEYQKPSYNDVLNSLRRSLGRRK